VRTKDPVNLVDQLAGAYIEYEYRLEIFWSGKETFSLEIDFEMIETSFNVGGN
jgi:hypothetical protein